MRLPKAARSAGVSIVVLIAIFLVGGVAYTYISNPADTKHVATTKVSTVAPEATIKPTLPSPNAPEGVSVESLTTPVKAGANASMIVKTNAGSNCTVSVVYNGVPSTDSGLGPKVADQYGNVTWTWTVGGTVSPGNWPVKATCVYHGRSAVVQTTLQVQM